MGERKRKRRGTRGREGREKEGKEGRRRRWSIRMLTHAALDSPHFPQTPGDPDPQGHGRVSFCFFGLGLGSEMQDEMGGLQE